MKLWDRAYVNNASDTEGTRVDVLYATQDMVESDRPALPDVSTDYLYLGLDRTFDGIYLGVEGGSGDYDVLPEYTYWNGSDWVRLPLQIATSFRESGVARFPIPESWAKRDDNYFIRIKGSDADTSAKLIDSFPFPSYAYTTPEEVADLMTIRYEFTDTTKPSRSDVERIIRRIEGRMEGYTTTAWKPQYRENEDYSFNRRGFVLKRVPIIKLLNVQIWEGGGYRDLMEGREHDYFVEERTGIINFSRFFHLPFAYSRVRTYGFGEHRNPVRARYIWGKDIDLDDRGYMVKDVATKLTIADVWSSYDFTASIPQGNTIFGIDSRIERWTNDAEERLEELRPLRLWVP